MPVFNFARHLTQQQEIKWVPAWRSVQLKARQESRDTLVRRATFPTVICASIHEMALLIPNVLGPRKGKDGLRGGGRGALHTPFVLGTPFPNSYPGSACCHGNCQFFLYLFPLEHTQRGRVTMATPLHSHHSKRRETACSKNCLPPASPTWGLIDR